MSTNKQASSSQGHRGVYLALTLAVITAVCVGGAVSVLTSLGVTLLVERCW
jgi:hypothetical protein